MDRLAALMVRLARTDQQVTMVRLDRTDLMAHAERDALLHHVVQQERTVQQEHTVQQERTVHPHPTDRPDRMDHRTLQVADQRVVGWHAVLLVLHTPPRVRMAQQRHTAQQGQQGHTDLTHQLGRTYGNFSRCFRSDGSLLKLEFRKRHLVTSNSG
ncbi:MAG: hypothetical protein WKF77_12200 [Planctomycetaceae bacterium]